MRGALAAFLLVAHWSSCAGQPLSQEGGPTADRAASQPADFEQPGLDDERVAPVVQRDYRWDRPGLPQALALAFVLVAIPVAVLIRRLVHRDAAPGGTQSERDEAGPPRWHPLQAVDRAVWSSYLASVAMVAGWVVTSIFFTQRGAYGYKSAAVLLVAGMSAMTIAPLYPMAGPLVYFVLSYAVQREDAAATRIDDSGVMECLPVLALAALGLRLFRQRRCPPPPRDFATWALLAMMAWIGLTVAGAAMAGLPLTPKLVHRAARFAQILVLFLVAAHADAGLAELRLTSLVLALTFFARVHAFRADVALEQNLAMLAAMVCPLLFVTARTAPARLAKLGFYLQLAYFVCLTVYIQNRGAMVALAVAATVLLLSSRHRVRALVIAAPVAVGLAAWLPGSGLLDRFTEIYQEGEFQGSAYFRLRIWAAGWQMAREHAALGVGPGNFELLVEGYDPDLPPIGPHNSFVQMAAETGLVGVALYVAFIVAAGQHLASTVRRCAGDWRGCVAGGILACLGAYVATGCFLENPSLAVTYVVLALGIALSAAPVTRVYRERLYLPLPDVVARPLADLVVRWPRVVSGMPVAGRAASRPHRPADERANCDAPRPNALAAGAPRDERRRDARLWLPAALAVYAAVTVAGSLAPFSFRPLSLRAAMHIFLRQMSRPFEFSDRSDWLANVLLFVPLGFLALAACCPRRQSARRLAASIPVVAGCLVFSSFIELVQVWYPSRTVNPNDVAAESLGAAAGAIGFLLFGDWLVGLASALFEGRNRLRTIEKLLLCYAAGVIVYAAWPFDVTINPADFAGKLREGRIRFADWTQPGWLAAFAASAALMAPIGVLLRTAATRQGHTVRRWPAIIGWGLAWLLAIESCRLLAFSQSVSLLHVAGGAAGILLGGLARNLFSVGRTP